LSDEAKDIIDRLTVHDPQERLGLNGYEEVLNHPFFKGVDWDKLRRKEYDMSNTKPEKSRREQLDELEAEETMVDEDRAKRVWYGGGKGGSAGIFMNDWKFQAFGQKKDSEEGANDQMNVDKK